MGLDEITSMDPEGTGRGVTKTLSTISEKLWQFGDVPITWKRENIIHILKRVHKDGMGNYRLANLTYVSGPIIGQTLPENTEVHKKIIR